jgi:4-amino-4-deoxy-L-arabinose transferase-like glycosyltransferase
MEFWILVGVWCFLRAERRNSWVLGAVAGVCVGLGYLAKEPAAFVAPALALVAWQSGRRVLAVAVAMGALAVAGTESVVYQLVFGDPLHRLEAARVGGAPWFPGSGDTGGTGILNSPLSERLLKTYPRQMLYPNVHFGLHYVVALFLAGVAVVTLRHGRFLLLLWAALPWTFLNFGGAVMPYRPLWTSVRYISITLPPLFVLAAGLLAVPAFRPHARSRILGAVLVVVSVTGIATALSTRASGYRTNDVAVLRSIVARASENGDTVCHPPNDTGHGDERLDSWTETLGVLDSRGSNRVEGQQWVVVADPLGLPSVQQGTCPAR